MDPLENEVTDGESRVYKTAAALWATQVDEINVKRDSGAYKKLKGALDGRELHSGEKIFYKTYTKKSAHPK